jgi:hypothetical protein
LELKQSGQEFPANLDEVWALAYSTKGSALRTLQSDFVQDVDFTVINRNVKSDTVFGGFRNTAHYYLSVPCLEYFIAKKVKPVFEVYRSVFHKAVELHQQLAWQGVPTIYSGGRVWVNYRAALRQVGFSTQSGAVAARKRNHAAEFEKFFNQNFVTVVFAETMRRQAGTQLRIRNLELGIK